MLLLLLYINKVAVLLIKIEELLFNFVSLSLLLNYVFIFQASVDLFCPLSIYFRETTKKIEEWRTSLWLVVSRFCSDITLCILHDKWNGKEYLILNVSTFWRRVFIRLKMVYNTFCSWKQTEHLTSYISQIYLRNTKY